MYIRRKVFSKLQTEDGQERYFSTTEFTLMSDAEERIFVSAAEKEAKMQLAREIADAEEAGDYKKAESLMKRFAKKDRKGLGAAGTAIGTAAGLTGGSLLGSAIGAATDSPGATLGITAAGGLAGGLAGKFIGRSKGKKLAAKRYEKYKEAVEEERKEGKKESKKK